MTVTRGKTIPYVDDTITKKVMANVNATSFGVQFIWMSTSYSKIIKSKHIVTAHVYKSEQDFVGKYDVKTQPALFKTVQFKKINSVSVGQILRTPTRRFVNRLGTDSSFAWILPERFQNQKWLPSIDKKHWNISIMQCTEPLDNMTWLFITISVNHWLTVNTLNMNVKFRDAFFLYSLLSQWVVWACASLVVNLVRRRNSARTWLVSWREAQQMLQASFKVR